MTEPYPVCVSLLTNEGRHLEATLTIVTGGRGGQPMGSGGISRRRLLGGAAGGVAAWFGADWLLRAEAASKAMARFAVRPELTTLRSTFVPTGTGAYRRLVEAPGFPTHVRTLGAEAKIGREARRVALACLVHLTDIHVIDAQSPARVEFLDRYGDDPTTSFPLQSAYRPQETLTAHVAEAMVQRVNAIGGGPITGRPYDCAVSTGDSIDNAQVNELAWYLALLDGGPLTPDSGRPGYQGVMDQDALSYDVHYWHPDDPRPAGDLFKADHGFPTVPGLLAASVAPFTATGLSAPWYATYGNHDGLLQGNAPANPALSAVATGGLKVVALPAGLSPGDLANGLARGNPAALAALATAPARVVAADPARRPASVADWVEAHLRSPAVPGPAGHGLTDAHRAGGPLLFSFPIAPGVLGISLDTCARGGSSDGNLFEDQVAAVTSMLKGASRAHGGTDQLVVLFSHHNLATLDNPVPDPAKPLVPRITAAAFEARLHEFPNVVLWVNGHSHENRVTPHPRPGGGGFWEVLTAAHVDWPQQARIVELADNGDGTLSIFGTLTEHAAPARPGGVGPGRVLDLAAWSRELSFNDPQADLGALGAPGDRNVELVLPAPFDLRSLAATSPGGRTGSAAGAGVRGELPATGRPSTYALTAAAVAAAAAVTARRVAVGASPEGPGAGDPPAAAG